MPQVRNSVANEEEIDTVLDVDIIFSGTIETEKSLLIKGKVSGSILCGDDLFISKEAVVDADIRGARVTVRGALTGTVRASESIQIIAGSSVEASLEAPEIIIEDKEHFRGTTTVLGEPDEDLVDGSDDHE